MPATRTTDPITSHEAEASVKNLTGTQQAILQLLTISMTDDELMERYQLKAVNGLAPMSSASGIRTRRHELVERGLVEEKGYAESKFGRRAIIWGAK